MNVLNELDKLEQLVKANRCLQVNRCKGSHCIEVSVKPGKFYKDGNCWVEDIIKELEHEEFNDLVYNCNGKHNIRRKIRICINLPDYSQILSDNVQNHIDRSAPSEYGGEKYEVPLHRS